MNTISAEIEQAKKELTLEAFAARQLVLLSGKLLPLWLCTSPEVQQELLGQFRAAYERWVASELAALVSRIENDPLARRPMLHVVPTAKD